MNGRTSLTFIRGTWGRLPSLLPGDVWSPLGDWVRTSHFDSILDGHFNYFHTVGEYHHSEDESLSEFARQGDLLVLWSPKDFDCHQIHSSSTQ